MLADPLVLATKWSAVTIDTTRNYTFPCIERAADHSLYRMGPDSDGAYHDIFVGHQFGRRNRFTARYTISGLTPNQLTVDQLSRFSQSVYVVVDVPPTGPVDLYGAPGTPITMIQAQMLAIGGLLVETDAQLPLIMDRVNLGET